jgi:hypothetical protein
MRQARLPAGVALVVAAVLAGCLSATEVPFGVRATETVWCADAAGVVDTVTRQGHGGPLTDLDVKVVQLEVGAVSEDDLLDACARRFRWPASATLCEAYAAPEGLERYVATEFVSERYGEPGLDRPGFPVVVRGRASCEDVRLDAGPAAAVAEASEFPIADQLRDWQDTDRFNDWRAREAVWREAADDGCLEIDTARQHALTARAELAGDWPVLETACDPEDPSHEGLCLDVRLHREGYIAVSYHDVVTPGGRTGPVDDIRDVSEPASPADR